MLSTMPLLEITAINKKMAKQITVLHTGNPTYRAILRGLENDTIRPFGWVASETIDGIPDNSQAWLVEYNKTLYWIPRPFQPRPDYGMVEPPWMIQLKPLQIFVK